MMIDTHSHLFSEEFTDDLPEVIDRARQVGVTHIFMPNIDDTTVDAMLRVAARYPGYCYPMLGFHPTSVDGDALPKVRRMKELGNIKIDVYVDVSEILHYTSFRSE